MDISNNITLKNLKMNNVSVENVFSLYAVTENAIFDLFVHCNPNLQNAYNYFVRNLNSKLYSTIFSHLDYFHCFFFSIFAINYFDYTCAVL